MIDPITGAALGEALGAITGQMAGQSLADAYNQRMTDTYIDAAGIEIGVGTYTDVKPSISGDTSNTVVDSQDSDPSIAFDNYETAGGVIDSTTGGFIYGSNVGTYNYCLLETENQEVKAVAPVSVPVETAYVAIAQALGLSMKVSEVDPILANKFAQGIIAAGCVYDAASGLVTAWWDGVNMLFPKSAIDAVQQTMDEEGIPPYDPDVPDVNEYSYLGGSVDVVNGASIRYAPDYTSGYEYACTDGVFLVSSVAQTAGTNILQLTPTSRNISTITVTSVPGGNVVTYSVGTQVNLKDGTIAYTGPAQTVTSGDSTQCTPDPLSCSPPQNIPSGYTLADIYYLGENVTPVTPTEYPAGMWRSIADNAYTPETMPVAGGIARKIDGGTGIDTIEVSPIRIDEDSLAGDTSDSTVDPITANPDPDINQELPPAPVPTPIPDTNVSNPDVPLVDSSVVDSTLIDELVEELANTLDPQPEQSSGTIPFPFMPGVPVDPTDPSQGSSYPSIVPASGSGLIHVYNPTPGEFVGFGNWLWVTYADATIDKIWNNPFDGIIGAHELYATPQTDGRDNIRSGFLVCPVQSDLVRQRYTEIDCGTVIVPEFYGNYFDYSPYSQAYIYLPFIGINEVSIDDIVGHAVNIRYRVDAYNGSCIAMIYVAKSGYRNLCYQFAGNCAVEVPLAGGSQAAIKAGMLQAEAYARATVQSAQIQKTASIGSGIVHGAAAGSGAGPIGGILGALAGGTAGYIQGSANAAAAKLQGQAMQEAARYANKSSVQHSGQFGASHGAMGLKIPFIMIRNPIQVKVVNYNDDYGFPAHKRVIVGGCTGYLRVREVNVISAHATNEEKRAIEEELKAGVYVS